MYGNNCTHHLVTEQYQNDVASQSLYSYQLNDYKELSSIVLDMQSKICKGKDLCESAGCSHSCYTSNHESFCTCPSDMILDVDYKTCVAMGSSIGANMCMIHNGGCDHRYD